MFPRNLNVAGDVAARWASDAIAIHPSRGHGVNRIVDQDMCVKGGLSELDQRLTLQHVASRGVPIFIRSSALNEAVDRANKDHTALT